MYTNQLSTRDKFEDIVTEKKFKAKRFAKAELALLYNWHPDTLRRKLHENKELMDELVFASYKKTNREFTKQQVKIIFSYLGEPYQ